MKYVIVPNHISEAINAQIDRAIAKDPRLEEVREQLFNDMLHAYDIHGVIADIEPKNAAAGGSDE